MAEPSDIPWSELIPAIVGGIIGALAGGLPAYFLALRSSSEVLERDRIARLEQEKAAAFRAHVRIAELINGVLSLHSQIEEMVDAAKNKPNVGEHLWLAVTSIVGMADDRLITIDASEAAIFVAAGAEDYVNDLLLLPKRYRAVASALDDYRKMRERLTDQMPLASFDGELGSAYLTPEQSAALMPRMIELNSVIRGVRQHLATDRIMALRLARDFAPTMKRHFGVEKFPGFTLEDGTQIEEAVGADVTTPANGDLQVGESKPA